MNKKKILSIIMISALSVISMSNFKASANAGVDFGDDFDYTSPTYRPAEGYLNKGSWMKNPTNPSLFFGNGSMYSREKTKLVNHKFSSYGQTFYYYAPVGYINSAGKLVKYNSPQYAGVLENKFSKTAKLSYQKEASYHNGVFGNKDNINYSKKENKPNHYDYNAWNTQKDSNIYRTSTFYDSQTKKYGSWRFIGYSMEGNALENPFFPTDGFTSNDGRTHASNSKMVWRNIHGFAKPAKNAVVPTMFQNKLSPFDDAFYYNKKVKAIERLMAQDSKFQNPKLQYHTTANATYTNSKVWKNGGKTSAKEWAEVLSLQNNPDLETPLFTGYRLGGQGTGGLFYSTVLGKANEKLGSDMEISEIVAYKGKEVVAKFTRGGGSVIYGNHKITPGNDYDFKYTVKNVGTSTLSIAPAKLDTGASLNANSVKNDHEDAFPNRDKKHDSTLSSAQTSKLKPKQSATFTRTLTVPTAVKTGWKPTAFINNVHAKNNDNLFKHNDWGYIRFNQVAYGDMSADSIYYKDANGNKVTTIMPGEKYKIGFNFKYTGPNLDKAQNLKFKGQVTRPLPQSKTSETKTYEFNKNNVKLKNGDVFSFETDYIVFEQPEFTAVGTILPSANDEIYNSNDKNDSYQKSYKDVYDYIISNVRVIPGSEKPLKDGYITIGVKYDAELIAPSHVNKEFDITNHLNVGGQIVSVTDHIRKGKNFDLTHTVKIKVGAVSTNTNKPISVELNADKKKWEDNHNNNKGSTNFVVKPFTKPTDFVNGTGCAIGTTNSNSWGASHYVYPFAGSNVSYKNFSGNRTYNFYNYTKKTGGYTVAGLYNESYTIDNVLFKSKFTVDNKYGKNGWVDLTNASEKKKAKIKAGYGYELEVNVSYKTNAMADQPKASWNRNSASSSGTAVSNLQTAPNFNNDIYVRTSDGKYLSSTGISGTIRAFDSVVVKNTQDEIKVKYKMRTKASNGVQKPMNIFVSETAKDGDYGLNVWTPSMSGVGSSASKKELCDYKKLSFAVQGSMHDDDSDHIVQ